MSTTPTANITSDSFPSQQTPSRRPEHDAQVPLSHCTAPSSARSPLTADLTSSHNRAQGPSHHSPPDQHVSTRRPTKRQRQSPPANMAAERASSSSDASSQSGMADNETEAERCHLSEAQPATAPPKKKRTRTLTTPHQSAVLHALLAKSRFPTTAAREEVGRQIGLSARKVQIWFQNQRQKARRPQSESAPLTRPPQFGPFPIMTPAGPSSNHSPTASGPLSEVSHSASSSVREIHESGGSLDSIPPLSGPGIPGSSSSSHPRRPPSIEDWDTPRRAPASPKTPLGNSHHSLPLRLPEDISTRDSRGSTRGLAPQSTQSMSPHFSRVLPPIHFSPLESTTTEPYVSATPSFPPQPPSRSGVNILQHHDAPIRPPIDQVGPVPPTIPPPFVLQPPPQWDPQTFVPYTRPEFASWSQPSGSPLSSARSSFSAVGAHDRAPPVSSPRRHFFSSPGAPLRATHLDHIMSPSRSRQLSASAPPSRASLPGDAHARSDDHAGEA